MVQRALAAGALPGGTHLTIAGLQLVFFLPAQNETGLMGGGLRHPRRAGKALIPDVHHLPSPAAGDVREHLGFFGPLVAGLLTAGRPPAQMG